MKHRETISGLEAIADYIGVSRETVKQWIKVGRPESRAFRKMGGKRFAFVDELDLVRAGKPERIKA